MSGYGGLIVVETVLKIVLPVEIDRELWKKRREGGVCVPLRRYFPLCGNPVCICLYLQKGLNFSIQILPL